MRAKRIAAPKSSGKGKPTMLQAAENIGAMVSHGTKSTGKGGSKFKKAAEKKAAPKKAAPAKAEKPQKAEKPAKPPKPAKEEKPRARTSRKDGLPQSVDLSFDKY